MLTNAGLLFSTVKGGKIEKKQKTMGLATTITIVYYVVNSFDALKYVNGLLINTSLIFHDFDYSAKKKTTKNKKLKKNNDNNDNLKLFWNLHV